MESKLNSYFLYYIINIVLSISIWKFYDPNMRFLLPMFIIISIFYIPIFINEYIIKKKMKVFFKNILYIFLGFSLYIIFIITIHGKITKDAFCSLVSLISVYTFLILMIIHIFLNYDIKIK